MRLGEAPEAIALDVGLLSAWYFDLCMHLVSPFAFKGKEMKEGERTHPEICQPGKHSLVPDRTLRLVRERTVRGWRTTQLEAGSGVDGEAVEIGGGGRDGCVGVGCCLYSTKYHSES